MIIMELEKAEEAITQAIRTLCDQLSIEEDINTDLCPGKFLRSDALVSIIPSIEQILHIKIPLDCYIFHDNNINKEKLSITAAAKKLLKFSKQ